jgi:AcrR family transcriptional regulator
MATDVSGSLEARIVSAGLRALGRYCPAELTVRRVAEFAGTSTMGIYSRFGGRAGMLAAIYRRGFEMLRDELVGAVADPDTGPAEAILALTRAYRTFALPNPALYALMFERPLADFEPTHQQRSEAIGMTFGLLTEQVSRAMRQGTIAAGGEPEMSAYLIWTAVHGLISIELTHALRNPLPGWILATPEAGERALELGVRAILAGLR